MSIQEYYINTKVIFDIKEFNYQSKAYNSKPKIPCFKYTHDAVSSLNTDAFFDINMETLQNSVNLSAILGQNFKKLAKYDTVLNYLLVIIWLNHAKKNMTIT